MSQTFLRSAIFCLFLLLFTCKNERTNANISIAPDNISLNLQYATGFKIENRKDHKLLHISNPWPEANKDFTYALVNKAQDPKLLNLPNEYNGVIKIPIESIVVTSTTHIPALELLNEHDKLIGFPGTDYVSSKHTRQRIEAGQVQELGKNEGINTEIILNIQPDVVIGFGVDGTNKSFNTIKNANIPVVYNGDWTEASALAKAEWIKFFGVLFGKEKQADSIFSNIESEYLKAKKIASKVKNKPTILSGAMHKDVWYLPNGSSSEAQLLKDANTDYLWSETSGSGSLALNFENVFEKGKDADIWISPSYYKSLEELEKANSHYTNFKAFKNKKVYSFSMTTGDTGGVLYYELGMARPDLVLKDLIKTCHPELLKDYETYFFKQLN